jgi:hypothetical protein
MGREGVCDEARAKVESVTGKRVMLMPARQ